MVVRTYAPRGQTPILRVRLTRDHLSAIGGITQDGRLFMQMQEPAYKAVEVIAFLRMLLRKIPGDLLIIWDGSPIHRADVVKAFLTSPQGKRVHLEPFVFNNSKSALPHFKCACLLLLPHWLVFHREISRKNEDDEDGWIAISSVVYWTTY